MSENQYSKGEKALSRLFYFSYATSYKKENGNYNEQDRGYSVGNSRDTIFSLLRLLL